MAFRSIGAPGLVWRTVRHLKPIQVWGQVRTRVVPRRAPAADQPLLSLREPTGSWARGVVKPSSWFADSTFRFLNVERRVEEPTDWHTGDVTYLWFYNLQYHDWLNQAEYPGGVEAAVARLRGWVADSPMGTKRAWEPYPISLRVVNWLRFALERQTLPPDLLQSLLAQVRWLRQNLETHLLANHYFTNGKTLFMAGGFFAGAEADEWLATGRRIVESQLAEQVLDDGGHYERSPMYQGIVIEDVIDLLNTVRTYRVAPAAECEPLLCGALRRLLSWAEMMRFEDEAVPHFNDAAQGIAPGFADLCQYAERVGAPVPPARQPGHGTLLAESGFARLERGPARLFCDVGSVGPAYQPGHAHAGTLSFELALHGTRVLVNVGTSTYDPGPLRSAQRATSAHNTLDVDEKSSSEVWASFRVGTRARARVVGFTQDGAAAQLRAEHDGYVRQRIAGLHRRSWQLGAASLHVEDELDAPTGAAVRAYFHFAPGVTLQQVGERSWDVLTPSGLKARFTGDQGCVYTLQRSLHYPEFGRAEGSFLLSASLRPVTETRRCRHVLTW